MSQQRREGLAAFVDPALLRAASNPHALSAALAGDRATSTVEGPPLTYRATGAQSYADAGAADANAAQLALNAAHKVLTAPMPDRVAQMKLKKDPTRKRSHEAETQRGGLRGELQFVRPHRDLDVWYCHAPLPEAVHSALVRDVTVIGDATRDHFVVSYQNVIDPNLCVARLPDAELARIDAARERALRRAGGTGDDVAVAHARWTAHAAVRTAERLATQLPRPPNAPGLEEPGFTDPYNAPLRALTPAERQWSKWMHFATARTEAAVSRATSGTLGPVAPPPVAHSAAHRAAVLLAATSHQYRWQATTIRVEYKADAWPAPAPAATALAATSTAAAPANGVITGHAAAAAPSAVASGGCTVAAAADVKSAASAAAPAGVAAAAPAAPKGPPAPSPSLTAQVDAAREFPHCSVSACSPIHELKRTNGYDGLYSGVEAIFAAAYPVLRTLWCWTPPLRGDFVEPFDAAAHDARTCFVCLATTPVACPAVRAHAHARSQPCPYAHPVTDERVWRRDDDDPGRVRHATRGGSDDWLRYDRKQPHAFRGAGVGPPPPTLTYSGRHSAVAAAKATGATSSGRGAAGTAHYQVVVKAQKVVIQPGATYQGVWHDEGLHERVVAAVVYYHTVPACVSGGGVQFASKGKRFADSVRQRDLKSVWGERAKVVVDIKERDLLVFSNYQTVHRVLAMHNSSAEPVCREFVCLFVIDPLYPVPSTAAVAQSRDAVSAATGLPHELVSAVLECMGECMGAEQRAAVRRAVFSEQMRPKELGAWIVYTTGNSDCNTVMWSTASDQLGEPDHLLRGTSSDAPAGVDGRERDDMEFVRNVPGFERPPDWKPLGAQSDSDGEPADADEGEEGSGGDDAS